MDLRKTRNKAVIALLSILSLSVPALAENVSTGSSALRNYFVNAPFEVIPTITRISRLDMLDYFDNGMSTAVKTLFDDGALIIEMNDDVLRFNTSSVNQVAMSLLIAGSDTAILVINSVQIPEIDSRTTVYDTSWNKRFDIGTGSIEDWLSTVAKKEKKLSDVENLIDFISASAEYDPQRKILILKETVTDGLVEPDKSTVAGMIVDKREFQLSPKSYKTISEK